MKILHRVRSQARYKSETSHQAIVGKSGTGKGFFGERILSLQKGIRVDLFSLERNEGMLYSVPNNDPYLIQIGKRLTNGTYKPIGFKNKVCMLSGHKLQEYKEFPSNIDIVSLRESDLDKQDIIDLLGTTDSAISLLYMIFKYLEDEESITKVSLKHIEKFSRDIATGGVARRTYGDSFKGAKSSTAFIISRNIATLRGSGIFDRRFPHLNISKFMKDPSHILTTSCTLLSTNIERAVGLGIILKKICHYARTAKEKIPIWIYFRELHTIYTQTMEKEENFHGMLRSWVYYILTEGRDNKLWLIADWQILDQVPDYIKYHFSKIMALRQPRAAARSLTNFAPIDNQTLKKITESQRGVGCYICGGKYSYPVYTIPPHFKKKMAGDNVFEMLKKIYGSKTLEAYIIVKKKKILKKSKEDLTSINTKPSVDPLSY